MEPGFAAVPWALVAAVGAVVVLHRWNHRRFDATGRAMPVGLISAALLIGCPLAAFGLAGSPLSWEFPTLQGFNFAGGVVIIPEFIALLMALSAYTASFIAEIVRAGIQSVGPGQIEAAYSLGLKPGQTLRLIVIPQALRVIVPPLTSQFLNLTKNSSLAVAIAYPDLVSVFMGTVLNQTGQAVEVIAITMAVYLVISLGISLLMNWYNRSVAMVER
jgi:general L-amino acid transport system permease protein